MLRSEYQVLAQNGAQQTVQTAARLTFAAIDRLGFLDELSSHEGD